MTPIQYDFIQGELDHANPNEHGNCNWCLLNRILGLGRALLTDCVDRTPLHGQMGVLFSLTDRVLNRTLLGEETGVLFSSHSRKAVSVTPLQFDFLTALAMVNSDVLATLPKADQFIPRILHLVEGLVDIQFVQRPVGYLPLMAASSNAMRLPTFAGYLPGQPTHDLLDWVWRLAATTPLLLNASSAAKTTTTSSPPPTTTTSSPPPTTSTLLVAAASDDKSAVAAAVATAANAAPKVTWPATAGLSVIDRVPGAVADRLPLLEETKRRFAEHQRKEEEDQLAQLIPLIDASIKAGRCTVSVTSLHVMVPLSQWLLPAVRDLLATRGWHVHKNALGFANNNDDVANKAEWDKSLILQEAAALQRPWLFSMGHIFDGNGNIIV